MGQLRLNDRVYTGQANGYHIYSASPQKVGIWITGDDLYEVTVATGGSVPTGGTLVERRVMTSYDVLLYTM